MPIYEVTDPQSGRTVELEGDSPPTEIELNEIFASLQPAQAPMTPEAEEELMASQLAGMEVGPGEDNLSRNQQPERAPLSAGSAIAGTPETLATLATGATTGVAGMGLGTIEGIVKEAIAGNFGTKDAADRIEQMAMKRMGQLTFEPKTEAGKSTLAGIAEAAEPLESLPPVLIPELLGVQFGPAAGKFVAEKLDASALPSLQKANMGFKKNDMSVGAAETPRGIERATTAESMPIPFEGDSALTKGQATRNFEQLQFEKETAKLAETGEALRDRLSNQTNTLIQNLDALADQPGPLRSELRDVGAGIDASLRRRLKSEKAKVDKLYKDAEEAGELRAPVIIGGIEETLSDISKLEDVAPNAKAITKYAEKHGIVDSEGTPMSVTLEDAERFRQFVNHATDIADPRESRVRRIVISAIDEATEEAGGDIYKDARKARSKMAQEFENTGITKRLLGTKKGTDERAIAYEDIFKKVFLDSPIEEVNKLRGTLLKSGDDGKQAWADLKAKGVEYIKENSMSASQMDERGTPLFSPDKFNRTIKSLDEKGKLDGIYGKRNAQIIRDLGDLAKDIYTAPPGAVNHSNTASALMVALDTLGTFAATGVPAPVLSTLKSGSKYIKDKKTRNRISESLNYMKEGQN